MAGYVIKMNILVTNINRCGKIEVRHKAYARPVSENIRAIKT